MFLPKLVLWHTIFLSLCFNTISMLQVENLIALYRRLVSSVGLAEGTIEFMKRKPTLLDGILNSKNLDLIGDFQIKNLSFEYPTRPGKICIFTRFCKGTTWYRMPPTPTPSSISTVFCNLYLLGILCKFITDYYFVRHTFIKIFEHLNTKF